VEWPAKRSYVGCYETVGLSITFSFPNHYLPPQNSGPCNSFYCLGHFKNVYDDDDDSGFSLCRMRKRVSASRGSSAVAELLVSV